MEKRYGILILGTFACAACFLLSACAGPAAEQSSVQPPYDGQIQDADVFIDMPNLRQYGGYTCGTTCVQMVMNWLDPYQADWNLAAYEEELGTNEEAGTPPGSIVSFFEANSVKVIDSLAVNVIVCCVYFNDSVEAFAAGMNEHLSKPINKKLLISTLLKYKTND